MPKNCCKCFTVSLVPIAALTLAILFALAIVALPILYEELTSRTKYGVVIDAGSSHTDLYVYSWDNIPKDTTSSDRITGKLKQISVCSSPVSLNDYVHHPDQAALAFSTCLDDSYREEITPEDERKHTYIYLGATAGMRLVNIANSTISDEILRAVRKKLNGSQYKFTDEKTQAQIIEKRVEAASGWVTANYADKTITSKSEPKTVGSLDLGGASVEIAFQPEPHVNYSSHYHADVSVFDHHYSLYARSYLCYGHNEALGRYRAYLVNQTLNSSQTLVVDDPCLPKGANHSMNTSKIFKRLCVSNSSVAVEAFGYELHPPQWLRADQNVTFNGTGNATVCDMMIQEVFDFPACNISDTCIDGRYFWPVLNNSGTFMAFSGFYYVASFYNEAQLDASGLDSFRDKVHNVCNSSYPPSRDEKQCFNGAFVLHLLEAGFGFNSSVNDWTIKFTGKVNDVSVGWALGYLMNITSTQSPRPYYTERPYTAVDLVIGIIVLSILCVVFVVFFFLTFHACRKVMKSRSGYTEVA